MQFFVHFGKYVSSPFEKNASSEIADILFCAHLGFHLNPLQPSRFKLFSFSSFLEIISQVFKNLIVTL